MADEVKTTVSACMMVKNEEAMIGDCLASIRDFVDEVILVDTGSTDRTIDIAQETTAGFCRLEIIRDQWQEDFSYHRNQSIAPATSEWILIIDADERLVGDDLPKLREYINSKAQVISLNVFNDAQGVANLVYLPSVRLFRRKLGLRYDGKIHNRLMIKDNLVAVKSPCRIRHLGYNLSHEEQAKKTARTLGMLEKQIAEDPKNAFYQYMYGNALIWAPTKENLPLAEQAYRIAFIEAADKKAQKHIWLSSICQLGLTYLMLGRYEEGLKFTDMALKLKPDYLDPLLWRGHLLMELKRYNEAIAAYERYLTVQASYDPNKDLANLPINNMNSRPAAERGIERAKAELAHEAYIKPFGNPGGLRLAIISAPGMRSFLPDIERYLAGEYNIRRFDGQSIEELQDILGWADLAWFEWCDDYLIEATRLPKTCKIICRLHSYEAFTDMPFHVDWTKVDLLIFVNQSVLDIVSKKVNPSCKTTVIHNGVDLKKFSRAERPLGKRIAYVGYLNYKKNPELMLYCFKKIHQYDPEYTLHIAGKFQDERNAMYFHNFVKKHNLPVIFDGWQEDIQKWLSDKDYIINTSLFEGCPVSIAEAVACGLRPMIHDWYGADNLYPNGILFSDPDGCLELLKKYERDPVWIPDEFLLTRFSLDEQLADISAAVAGLFEHKEAACVG